jgi:hypothetical protein
MNLKEIVDRRITEPFSLIEISYCIESYINKKKGTNIRVNLEKNIDVMPHVIASWYLQNNINNILNLFDKSREYLKNN